MLQYLDFYIINDNGCPYWRIGQKHSARLVVAGLLLLCIYAACTEAYWWHGTKYIFPQEIFFFRKKYFSPQEKYFSPQEIYFSARNIFLRNKYVFSARNIFFPQEINFSPQEIYFFPQEIFFSARNIFLRKKYIFLRKKYFSPQEIFLPIALYHVLSRSVSLWRAPSSGSTHRPGIDARRWASVIGI